MDSADAGSAGAVIDHVVSRLYLDLPLIDGQVRHACSEDFDGLPSLPCRYPIIRRVGSQHR